MIEPECLLLHTKVDVCFVCCFLDAGASDLSLSFSSGLNSLAGSTIVSQNQVLSFGVNLPANFGSGNLLVLQVDSSFNGEMLFLEDISFLNPQNTELLVQVTNSPQMPVTTMPPLPQTPPPTG